MMTNHPAHRGPRQDPTPATGTKQWWTPVWTGLVMDPEAKHYRQMKNAIWLFLYFLLNANRKTGFLFRKTTTICHDMGIPRDTILRWLGDLRAHGYVRTQNTGRCLHVHINQWKGVAGRAHLSFQKSQKSDNSVGKNPTAATFASDRVPVHLEPKGRQSGPSNDITLKKDKLKSNNDGDNLRGQGACKGFSPQTREELLAYDLAQTLDDGDHLSLYLAYAHRYPESVLRGILGQVKEVPSDRITKSYAALFHHLLQTYDRDTMQHKNPGM